MNKNKVVNVFMSVVFIASLLFGGWRINNVTAMPMDPMDESKVPHYFGPNPNWALSPLRLANVAVTLTGGGGTGAEASATVDMQTGAITGFTILNPGSGYTSAPDVGFAPIYGAATGTGASATAVVNNGVVNAVSVSPGGGGYTAPSVTFSGGGATTQATGTAYGGVNNAVLIAGTNYGGYTMPVVEFGLPNDPAGVQATGHATCVEDPNCTPAGGGLVTVSGIVVDSAGSGYSSAPSVIIRDGPAGSPVSALQNPATSTLTVQSVFLNTFGSGYTFAPQVDIADTAPGTGSGALAVATISASVTAINLDVTDGVVQGGSGYVTHGIKKFYDPLPGLCVPPNCPTDGSKYIPLAVAEAKIYNGIAADEYEIGLVQYRTSFSSSLPPTLVRGYVQIKPCTGTTSDIHLKNAFVIGPDVDTGYCGVTSPQYLGPVIAATKDKPVRIIFRNLLPTNAGGELFLPADSTIMGSGDGPMAMDPPVDNGTVLDEVRNPMCSEPYDPMMNPGMCFTENRATLHLHGGITPWISDGTAHQWITPANEDTMWPQGVTVSPVPDMGTAGCDGDRDGCSTFYYTNQQSARLMFYHDHQWGITRLNVYAGAAAGYLISDDTEKKLLPATADNPTGLGLIPGAADTIPLVIQDKTFVPDNWQLYNQYDGKGNVTTYGQDPTWDETRWGSYGDLWYHHVYMPAQNPGDPSGMSAYGRWMYGPWFWPPAANAVHGPIANPYYDANCDLNNPDTWQYQVDPFCEPQQIPGTPLNSVGMEQFNDTPIVNGVAYPTLTLEPKTYRLRILSAANDRFFNFQWYVADPNTASLDLNAKGEPIGGTEVAFNVAELAAAQLDPVVFPTPDTAVSLPGPDWIQIGTEGGFLPAPVVVDGQQVTTWITDPTRFDVGNVDQHSLLLAPAERADVIVDFSKFAGQTLILYNDAPAAFPARIPSYDYYTGAPDLAPNGAPGVLPGYGPNTRTIMQVKVSGTPVLPDPNYPGYDPTTLTALENTFMHNGGGTGVFESGQHPIIVGQAAYNSAYGKNFSAASNCNAPGSTVQTCDGFVRINDTQQFGFNTLSNPTVKLTLPLQPKAIHDEMNSTNFDEFGRMQAVLGVEAQPPMPGVQNFIGYPFVNPPTEIINATNLPKQDVTYDADGLPVSDIQIASIATNSDGTQIWRITHNGVDTHPIHWHLYDVQVINRVTWDNIIIPPDLTELGWKDTVRIAPLEDTIVALRPIIPELPWELPNAIRPLNPMMPLGSTAMFNNVDPQGNPTNPIVNQLVNFGWEYTYHCHILSHEEMDMMRPVSVVMPPKAPTLGNPAYTTPGTGNNARVVLNWMDNSVADTSFVIQSMDWLGNWTNVGTVLMSLDPNQADPLLKPDYKGSRSFTVPGTYNPDLGYRYRVLALNTVGYGAEFPSMTATSMTDEVIVGTAPLAPTNLALTLLAGPQIRLTWRDNAINEGGFTIWRSNDGVNFTQIATAPARNSTGNASWTDTTVPPPADNKTYWYKVAAVNPVGQAVDAAGQLVYSNTAVQLVPAVTVPTAPSNLAAALIAGPQIRLTWRDNATNETDFIIERSINGGALVQIGTVAAVTGTGGTGTFTDTGVTNSPANATYSYRVYARNSMGPSVTFSATSIVVPAQPLPPSSFGAVNGPNSNKTRSVILNWLDNSNNETGFTIERATNNLFTLGRTSTTVPANTTSFTVTGLSRGTQYWFRIRSNNGTFVFSVWVNATPLPITTNP